MQTIARWVFIIILITLNYHVYGQYLKIADGDNITRMQGDEINTEWSPDSGTLLFQSVIDSVSIVCLYQSQSDTLVCYSNKDYSFRNPVWHPDGDKIVFDSDKDGSDYLYVLDIVTHKVKPLFNRNIVCRNATFSSSSRQVYFTGYNELSDSWEIYSYDFVYDNLNPLTNFRLGAGDSDISSDGKSIVYCKANPFKRTNKLEVINWYGELLISFDEFNAYYPSWGPSGLKLYFVSNMDNRKEELYSIWKDGSHLERITEDEIRIGSPVVSPDGTKIAISVLTENGWDIFIFPFEDY